MLRLSSFKACHSYNSFIQEPAECNILSAIYFRMSQKTNLLQKYTAIKLLLNNIENFPSVAIYLENWKRD